MRVLVVALIGAVALASGVMLGFKLDSDGTEQTSTELATPGLPSAVWLTRASILAAAERGDYELLQAQIPEDGFEYTFGSPVEGGPIAYWQELERTTDERPLEVLAAILKMPYVLTRGYYVWPWAYSVENRADLSLHELQLIAPLGSANELVLDGTGYLGWRAGFEPDGTWAFFVSGD